MNEDDVKAVICVSWGKQNIPAIKVYCNRCKNPLALSAHNADTVREKKMIALCLPCVEIMSEEDDQIKIGGGMVGGELIEDIETAKKAAAKLLFLEHQEHSRDSNDKHSS